MRKLRVDALEQFLDSSLRYARHPFDVVSVRAERSTKPAILEATKRASGHAR
jgi:hypothetical protein